MYKNISKWNSDIKESLFSQRVMSAVQKNQIFMQNQYQVIINSCNERTLKMKQVNYEIKVKLTFHIFTAHINVLKSDQQQI